MVEQIGYNAGLVWNALNGSQLSLQELGTETGLPRADVCKALGWLAREGKLVISDGTFALTEGGDHGATETYGTVAGQLWQLLFGDPSEALSACLSLDRDLVYAGLGWLAKEGKVDSVDVFIVESLYSVEEPAGEEEAGEEEEEEGPGPAAGGMGSEPVFAPEIGKPLAEISEELAPFVAVSRRGKPVSRKTVKKKASKNKPARKKLLKKRQTGKKAVKKKAAKKKAPRKNPTKKKPAKKKRVVLKRKKKK